MNDEVGFGASIKSQTPKDGELEDVAATLKIAATDGTDVVTQYELEWAEDVYIRIKNGTLTDLSKPQQDMVDRITKKLEKEGLL